MKAIAMKMTQEQYESVREVLEHTKSITITNIGSFTGCPYLVTNYIGILGHVSNVGNSSKVDKGRTVYENFDKHILYGALGIIPVHILEYLNPERSIYQLYEVLELKLAQDKYDSQTREQAQEIVRLTEANKKLKLQEGIVCHLQNIIIDKDTEIKNLKEEVRGLNNGEHNDSGSLSKLLIKTQEQLIESVLKEMFKKAADLEKEVLELKEIINSLESKIDIYSDGYFEYQKRKLEIDWLEYKSCKK